MPRRQIPGYRLHKKSGQAIVTLSDPTTGRRRDFLLGEYGTKASKAEYSRVIAEWQANAQRVANGERAGDITMNELMVAYLKHAKSYYVKNGKTTAEYDCIKSAMRPLKEFYGQKLVKDFGPLAAKAVRQSMLTADWSRGFINRCMGRIKRLLRWGVENELVPVEVYAGVKEVAGLTIGRTEARETPGRHPVKPEHIEAVRKVVRQRTRDVIDLMLLTAARPGELLSLTTAIIDQSGPVWTARLEKHKTMHQGKERILYFGPHRPRHARRTTRVQVRAKD